MGSRDTLYLNATIHTMDRQRPWAEALLVRGDWIAAIGVTHEVEAAAGAGAARVDLQGRTVVPGFNDSHCHILGFGLTLEQVDVSADAVRTIADMRREIGARAASTPIGEWLIGRGYDQNMLIDRRHPTRRDLDEITPHHPVMLRHTSGHVLTCNSRALELAGISPDTPDPAGGAIDRDEHGEPTGVLKEAAMELVDTIIPPPSVEQGVGAIARAMETMARYGITSASDAATGTGDAIDSTLEMYRRAASGEHPPGRITVMPQIQYVAPPDSREIRVPGEFNAGDRPEWLTIGATKIFSDGALSTRTAAVREPYVDTGETGILLWPEDTLRDVVARAHAAGWQIAIHALGDRAVEVVVDAYERALRMGPRADHRHRIEHCMLADDALVRRIARAGIVPSLQPDIFRLGDGYVAGLGLERACDSIPAGRFRRLGVPVAFSSDCPVIPCDPLAVVRSAAERVTPAGVSLGREHAVPVMDGIRLYTAGGAFATHSETIKGSLSPGKLADFAVLSADPAALALDELNTMRVTMTVTGGVDVFNESFPG